MMYVATCTRCEKTQHIEARSLKIGTGCKYCRENDKREKETQRNADRRLQAKLKARQAADQNKAIDDKLPALICSGLSAKQIANALNVRHGVIVYRLRELGLRTAHLKRSKGQVFASDGRLATTKIQKKAVLEERKHNQRVAKRRERDAIKDDPIKLEAQRSYARRYQRLRRGLDPDAPIMRRGRKALKDLR